MSLRTYVFVLFHVHVRVRVFFHTMYVSRRAGWRRACPLGGVATLF